MGTRRWLQLLRGVKNPLTMAVTVSLSPAGTDGSSSALRTSEAVQVEVARWLAAPFPSWADWVIVLIATPPVLVIVLMTVIATGLRMAVPLVSNVGVNVPFAGAVAMTTVRPSLHDIGSCSC